MPANPLNTDDFDGQLYDLRMSDKARPLFEAVKKFIDSGEWQKSVDKNLGPANYTPGEGNPPTPSCQSA